MRRSLVPGLLVLVAVAGCGGEMARVKGRLVNGGSPVAPPPGARISLLFEPVEGGPGADARRFFPAILEGDGTFEVVASGGQVPPGTYRVSLTFSSADSRQSAPPVPAELAPFTRADSPLRATLEKGSNTLEVDLARPKG